MAGVTGCSRLRNGSGNSPETEMRSEAEVDRIGFLPPDQHAPKEFQQDQRPMKKRRLQLWLMSRFLHSNTARMNLRESENRRKSSVSCAREHQCSRILIRFL